MIKAKLSCEVVASFAKGQTVKFAVIDSTLVEPGQLKGDAAGELSLAIMRPSMRNTFVPGKEYMVTIEEIKPPEPPKYPEEPYADNPLRSVSS